MVVCVGFLEYFPFTNTLGDCTGWKVAFCLEICAHSMFFELPNGLIYVGENYEGIKGKSFWTQAAVRFEDKRILWLFCFFFFTLYIHWSKSEMYGKSKKNEALRTVNLQVFSVLDISAVVFPSVKETLLMNIVDIQMQATS